MRPLTFIHKVNRPTFGILLAGVLLASAAVFPRASAADPGRPVTVRALQAAGDLVRNLARSPGTVPGGVVGLDRAVLDEVFWVCRPGAGDAIYGLVPIRSGGEIVGVVAVNRAGERWLWCSFGYRGGAFPRVTSEQALERARARARSLGLAAPGGVARLIQGYDRRLYWTFEVGRETWLIDMDRADAPLLEARDRRAREVFAPVRDRMTPPEPPRRGERPPRDRASSAARDLPAAYNIPGIPYHYQITSWYCGPASLQMVMDYLGEEIDQATISDVANDIIDEGCYISDMIRSAHFSGMSTAIQNPILHGYRERKLGYACTEHYWGGSPDPYAEVKALISAHDPIFVCQWWDPGHTAGHYRVLKGYDDNLDVFIVHDPWYTAPFWGPNVLFDQTYFVTDLWDYSYRWGMIARPWVLAPGVPASVSEGDTFTVDLGVLYPGPYPFAGQYLCTGCAATIHLPAGFTLAGGSLSQTLPNLDSGDSVGVSWDVIAVGPPGDWQVSFQAQGILSASSYSYPAYSDSIGGRACETVVVGPGALANWEGEVRLTDDPASSGTAFPGGRAMVLEADGTVHVVWADTRDGNSEIYYRARASDLWQPETRLTTDPAFSDAPSIALGEDGRLHVAWVDTRDDNQEIYYKCWDPSSGWSADERVTTLARVDCNPSIAAGGGGVYLAWEHSVSSDQFLAVYFSQRTDTGWTEPYDPDAAVYRESYKPSLAWGTDGLLHLVYERESATLEMDKIRHTSWDGEGWSPVTVLSTDVSFSRGPVVAAGGGSTLHVVWQDGENVGGDIFYAFYDGAAWQPTEAIVTGGFEAGTPSVAVDGSGCVHVVWADGRHGDPEIYLVSSDGRGWGDEVRLSYGLGASIVPTVASNSLGEVCVVWTDLRHGNSEVYFRSTAPVADVAADAVVPAFDGPVRLSAPYPVPFTHETRLTFSLSEASDLVLEVFDVQGRRVRTLARGPHGPGDHSLTWDGRSAGGDRVAPGLYFVRCRTARGQDVRPVVLVR